MDIDELEYIEECIIETSGTVEIDGVPEEAEDEVLYVWICLERRKLKSWQ